MSRETLEKTSSLVLSLFPGGGLLDHAFSLEGFTVVRGPDPLWGGDIRRFYPPAGKFEGIIGGDPCQSHSSLANLVRAKGLQPSFPDLTPEYERVVNLARPAWFLRENVPAAPDIKPDGYDVRSFMLDNSTLDDGTGWGNQQMRRRRFWFGVRDGVAPELRQFIEFALFELPYPEPTVQGGCTGGVQGEALKRRQATVRGETGGGLDNTPAAKTKKQTVAADHRDGPVAIGGSGKRKVTAVATDGRHGHRVNDGTGGTVEGNYRAKTAPVTGRHEGRVGTPDIDYSPPRRTLDEMMQLQGMPQGWFKHSPFTVQGKRKIVGNGVPIPMGRMLARAVVAAMGSFER